MKKIIFIAFLWLSFIGYAQDNYIVKTDDGRRVLLKADYTWEYIDLTPPVKTIQSNEIIEPPIQHPPKSIVSSNCNVGPNFIEPKLNKRIQAYLKKGRATMKDLKKKVAKDYKCESQDVLLLKAEETNAKGVYTFCANGAKVVYKRTGNNFFKKGKLF